MTRLIVLAVLLASLSTAPVHAGERLLVTLGEVTSTSAVLWARNETGAELSVDLSAAESGVEGTTRRLPVSPDSDNTGKLILPGLEPATRYRYRVSSGTESVMGRFVTAPAGGDVRPIVFLWSGDLGGGNRCRRIDSGYPIFRAMAQRRPDFFLFVGDTVYADQRCTGHDFVPGADFKARSLSDFHRKHRYNREDATVQDFFRETAVYAIWDDHEVRNDFAGPTEPLAAIGLRAFLDYWPITPPDEDRTRLYRQIQWGGLVELFILDTRQYRASRCFDSSEKTMLGPAQRQWLLERVAASVAVWKIVVSSVPFSLTKGGPCGDSWAPRSFLGLRTGYPTERDALLNAWRERRVRNVIVVTADVHHAQLIRHRPAPAFTLHEFIAGPLAATPKPPQTAGAGLGSERLFARGGLNNFGEISVDQTALSVRILDERGEVLGTQIIEAEQ